MSFNPSSLFSFNFGPGAVSMGAPQQAAPMQNSPQPMMMPPAAKPDAFMRRGMNEQAPGNSNSAFFLPATQGNNFK
jgi:hypothetical protein